MLEDSLQQEKRIDLVERDLFSFLLELGARFLAMFVEKSGEGDIGKTPHSSEA